MERKKLRIVFLDRDGTLNEEISYLHRPEDLRMLPGAGRALQRLKAAGYLLVLITNQAGIARGYYSEEDCCRVNAAMNQLLGEEGAALDAAYYCPHHPEHGLGKYKKRCRCRKPEAGLFLQAEADILDGRIGENPESGLSAGELLQSPLRLTREEQLQLEELNRSPQGPDLSDCYMIGDKLIDTQAGHRFGIASVLVGTGYGKALRESAEPGDFDAYFETLEEAAEWIIQQKNN